MIPRYRVFHRRIEEEMAEVHQAANRAIEAQHLALGDERHAVFYLDSVAINLHGFYGVVKRILEWIARELDGGVPEARHGIGTPVANDPGGGRVRRP
jgi:hypothetical protein